MNAADSRPKLILRPGKEHPVRRFHPWIFSGAVGKTEGKPKDGDVVEVLDSQRNFLALGHFHEGSIAVKILSFRRASSPLLARHLGAREDEQGFCLRSVLEAGEQKKAYITTWFPADVGARFKRADFSDALIFETVQRKIGLRLEVVRFTVSAEVADDTAAELLQIPVGSPLLCVLMLYQASDGRNVELSLARHPADRFSITYEAPNNLE